MPNVISYVFGTGHAALVSLQWRDSERDGVSNHQAHDCLLKRLFRRRSKKTSKLRTTGLCAGNSPVSSEFPTQRASNAENVSIWWRHHVWRLLLSTMTCDTTFIVLYVRRGWYMMLHIIFKYQEKITYDVAYIICVSGDDGLIESIKTTSIGKC